MSHSRTPWPPLPPSVYTPGRGSRGGGGGVAVLGHPWSDQDPPVRDSPLETGPHRHASNLFSSRFAGRPTQLRPAGHTDEAPWPGCHETRGSTRRGGHS